MGDTGPQSDDESTDRRSVLRSIATATTAGGLGTVLAERSLARPVRPSPAADVADTAGNGRSADAVFPQSVASGGPTERGVILWTRIAPEAVVPGAPLVVELAPSADFDDVVYRGEVPAAAIGPEHDHTVKVDVDGELDSNRFYRYRFRYDGAASQVGRCRTLPASDDDPEEISFGLLSCQDYQNGYYGAYHHVAEADVDYVLHLGDFIYESADGDYLGPNDSIPEGRNFELPSGASLAETLADFRSLYRTYRSDPLLQSGLEQHTLIAGWDDHEIGNNRYWDYAADAPVVPNKSGKGEEFAMELTANGIQAWVEYMPARVEYDPSTTDLHEQFTLYRTLEFGDLVDLVVTDERLFRDGPACPNDDRVSCDSEDAQDRTMLGERQKEWWKRQVSTSGSTWTVWLNEVLTMPLTLGDDWYQVEFLQDSWDGYQAERYELMQHLAGANRQNFVTLTGDLHASLAGYMRSHYGALGSGGSERVGVELMTPAVSSLTADSVVDRATPWDSEGLNDLATAQNGHLQYMDWYNNGYAVVTFSEEECRYAAYRVDTETDSADAERSKLAEFRVPEGEIELRQEYNAFDENAGSGWDDGLGDELGEELGEEIGDEIDDGLDGGWNDWF